MQITTACIAKTKPVMYTIVGNSLEQTCEIYHHAPNKYTIITKHHDGLTVDQVCPKHMPLRVSAI